MDKEKKRLEEEKKKLEEAKSKKAKTYGDPICKIF